MSELRNAKDPGVLAVKLRKLVCGQDDAKPKKTRSSGRIMARSVKSRGRVRSLFLLGKAALVSHNGLEIVYGQAAGSKLMSSPHAVQPVGRGRVAAGGNTYNLRGDLDQLAYTLVRRNAILPRRSLALLRAISDDVAPRARLKPVAGVEVAIVASIRPADRLARKPVHSVSG